MFLVRDADKLITPQQQKFLYTMVDKATHFSWLVFFSVSRHDFAQNLQKQATSRIPKIQVSFDATHDYEEYCAALTQFLIPGGSKCEESECYKRFVKNLNFQTWLRPVFEVRFGEEAFLKAENFTKKLKKLKFSTFFFDFFHQKL